MTWEVTHHSDTGPDDDYYHEWWEVSNGVRTFKCDDKNDADWLCQQLNLFSNHNEDVSYDVPYHGTARRKLL